MLKSIIAVILFLGIVSASFSEQEYQDAFVSWMREHNRFYTVADFNKRYEAFKFNMDYVQTWNAGNSETVLGLNNMADLTNEEYKAIYLGNKMTVEPSLNAVQVDLSKVSITKDWRTAGAVTGVKDQGQCGSCWSFSATGSMEGAWFLKSKKLVSLSEQQLVDCVTSSHGCSGGSMGGAIKYVISNNGIDTEQSYPYTHKQGSCRFNKANIGATISSTVSVARGSESALVAAIDKSPVSVAIDASHNSFQLYKSGVYYEPSCSTSSLDHAVLAIGYDASFYLVKNSWGGNWGSQGYIQMSRNKNNNCGIATAGIYPIA